MRMKRDLFSLILSFLLFCLPLKSQDRQEQQRPMGPPPGSFEMLSENRRAIIPFELNRNHIVVLGKVNGKDLRLAVDTGLGVDGLMLHGSPRIDALGLQYVGQAMVGGAGEGDMVPADLALGVTINLPGVDLTEQTVIVMPFDSVRSLAFEGEDGAIGGSLFNHLVVEMDFDKMVIHLSEPDKFQYSGNGQVFPIKRMADGAPVLTCEVETTDHAHYQMDVVVDIGASHALSLNTTTQEGIMVPDHAVEYSLGTGVQGELIGHIGRVESLTVGDYSLKNIVTSFSSSKSLARMEGRGNLGSDVIRRFNVIFDYSDKNQRIILEPNSRFDEPFEFNMSGIGFKRTRQGLYRIVRIIPDSPASEVGLRVDDLVLEINGRKAAQISRDELHELVRKEGEVLDVLVSRDDEKLSYRIELRRLI